MDFFQLTKHKAALKIKIINIDIYDDEVIQSEICSSLCFFMS